MMLLLKLVYVKSSFALSNSFDGYVDTLAGSGSFGSCDGYAANASFKNPYNIAVDWNLNVFIADTSNFKIRKYSYLQKTVTTIAGSGEATFADGNSSSSSLRDK